MAGMALRSPLGETTDFHSLRKTFGTNLARAECRAEWQWRSCDIATRG